MKRLWRFCSFYVWNRFFESNLFIVFVFFSFFCFNTDASTREKPAWQRKSALAGTAITTPENPLDGRNRFRRMRSRLQTDENDRPMTVTTPVTPIAPSITPVKWTWENYIDLVFGWNRQIGKKGLAYRDDSSHSSRRPSTFSLNLFLFYFFFFRSDKTVKNSEERFPSPSS